MQSAIKKRSAVVGGRKTSISLEDEFWDALNLIARTRNSSLSSLLIVCDRTPPKNGKFVIGRASGFRSKSLPHALEAAMTLNDLKTGLGILKPGQMLSMSYAVYELIFPPGEPDELARTRAWAFAEEYGCTIKNLPLGETGFVSQAKAAHKTKIQVKQASTHLPGTFCEQGLMVRCFLRCDSLGGAKAAFPRSWHAQSRDHGQRCQGCAAPVGLDLDASARRGRKMTGVFAAGSCVSWPPSA